MGKKNVFLFTYNVKLRRRSCDGHLDIFLFSFKNKKQSVLFKICALVIVNNAS